MIALLYALATKIVGIFLDLDDPIIERLINDDGYFHNQVMETFRVFYPY